MEKRKIGSVEIVALVDTVQTFQASAVYPEADDALGQFSDYLDADGGVELAFTSFLINDGDAVILVDTGFGPENGGQLRAELAALLTATGAAFQPSATDVQVRELVFGAWPALIHICGGGSPLDSLATVHAALARRTDPALARVGFMALKQPWGRPDGVDRGRATAAVGHWGPTLVRLQEVALEVLG